MMRRADLDSAAHVAPGHYVIDGRAGARRGIVVAGPIADRAIADAEAAKLAARTKRETSVALVVELPEE